MSSSQPSQSNEEAKIIIACENCGKKLRVPIRRKNLHVACPICHHEFNYEFAEGSLVSDSIQKETTHPLPSPSKEIQNNSKASLAICPRCNSNDKVEKVSAIVEKGTHQISGTTQDWVSFSGTYTQELARKLTPPSKPDYSPPSFLWGIMPFTGVYWLAFWFAPISLRMKIVSILGLAFSIIVSCLIILSSANNNNRDMIFLFGLPIALSTIIIVLATYYIGLYEETTSRKAKINAELPKWEQAMRKWDKLYYCARNDCVFDPDPSSGGSIPADRMKELLFG